MALLTPPNSPNTLLVQVPLPQPVASTPQQANQPAQPQPQAKPAPAPKPDPFKKVKGPPAMIIPHIYQPDPSRKQMQRKRKSIKFSREDVEAILPNVQADPNDHASRGALADALEESGLHHDDESLDHLRAFDRPVYGMKHPGSGKYVFSPRRRWLLGELVEHEPKGNYVDFKLYHKKHFGELKDRLKTIGLEGHASFFDKDGSHHVLMVDNKKGRPASMIGDPVYSPVDLVINRHDNPMIKTKTTHGGLLSLFWNRWHPYDKKSEDDFTDVAKQVSREHQEMQEEDKLYSDTKKKEQFKKKRNPVKLSKIDKLRVQFSRSAVKSLLHQIGDDPKLKQDHHLVMTDALEESGSGTLGRLIRSYVDGNKTNQHVDWLHTDGNPLHGLVDQRTMFPAIGVDHFGKHGDFHVFHESDHDGENGKHLLHFIHDDSYHTGHPQIRYQFEFHPHELYQFAHDLKNDEGFNVDGEAGKNLVDRLDYWIEKSGEAQAKHSGEQEKQEEPIPFNRSVKFNKDHWGTPEFKNWFGDWQSSPEQASKVVNPDGTPKVVYHGTKSPANFTEFSTEGPPQDEEHDHYDSGSGQDPSAYIGAHFAEEPHVANSFATHTGPSWLKSRYVSGQTSSKVFPVYLSIKNPKLYKSEDHFQSDLYKQNINTDELESMAYDSGDEDEFYDNYDSDEDFREQINREIMDNVSRYEDPSIMHDIAKQLASSLKDQLASAGHDGIGYKNDVEGGNSWVAFHPHQVKSSIANNGNYSNDSGEIHMERKTKNRKPVKFKLFERLGNIADFVASSPVKASNLATDVWNKTGELYTDGELFSTIGRGVDKAAKGIWHGGLKWGQALAKGLTGLGKKLPLGLQGPSIKQLPAKPKGKTTTPPAKTTKRKSLAQPFNPTEGDWKAEHLFGDHPVRSHLEHYRNNWIGHSDKNKDRIGRLADKALQGYWYSKDVKGANVFHEIQRQLKNMGHKDADKIDWSGHHDELAQEIKDRKKAKKPEQMAKFRSPAGGMVVRGQFYPGGKMLPLEATQTNPPPDKKMAARKKKPDSLAKLREFFKPK